ncbi:hypothetical protein [Planctellipticum variicoloris]|uniref:hypothetical protein n=1 Tax=Planctellipticum variicoloris TaxID=3064265 RepID=UPI0030133F00|nr:hypothetical protein SH412_004873 [Planctomycetaceae bacterium SH412]
MKTSQCWSVLVVIGMIGCSAHTVGTEAAARKFFDVEFQKWMAGEKNSVSTMVSRISMHQEPISYEIRSVVPDEPDFLAYDKAHELPKDWRTWPAFKLNVAIEWKSQAGTPLTNVTTYTLTWNADEKRWYVMERF